MSIQHLDCPCAWLRPLRSTGTFASGGSACRYLALRAFVNKARPLSLSQRVPFKIPRGYPAIEPPPISRDYRGVRQDFCQKR
jgi:hypothetical protein